MVYNENCIASSSQCVLLFENYAYFHQNFELATNKFASKNKNDVLAKKFVRFYFTKMDISFFFLQLLNASDLLPTKSCANYAIHKLSY